MLGITHRRILALIVMMKTGSTVYINARGT